MSGRRSTEEKTCKKCRRTLSLSSFRVANGERGRSDTCRNCEDGTLFTCTKCGGEKFAYEFATDPRRTTKLHSWCRACKNLNTREREAREKAESGDKPNNLRKIAYGKPRLTKTMLYNATPRKPFAEWTDKERANWRKALLNPKRRAEVRQMRERRR